MWFDPELVQTVGELAPPWLVLALAFLSFLGSAVLIVPLAGWLYLRGDRRVTAPLLAAVALIYAAMTTSKALVASQRPAVDPPVAVAELPLVLQPAYEHAALIETGSFPSGHALAVLGFWALLAVDTDVGTRARRYAAVAGVVAVVAASRVVLGAHYLGDVVGGFVLGAIVLGVVLAVRSRATDPTAVLFGLAAVVATVGVLAGLVSSSAATDPAVVAGGSLGALLGWRVTDGATSRPAADRLPTPVPRVATVFARLHRRVDGRSGERSSLRLVAAWGIGGLLALGAIGVVGATSVNASLPTAAGTTLLAHPLTLSLATGLVAAAVVATPAMVATGSDRR